MGLVFDQQLQVAQRLGYLLLSHALHGAQIT
ncbi:hypothetical protein ZBT109_2167 [Zymobacter palmae]|uniref:Uncharacterized protein n=1 Tax=Zymobacter palmae TaxID=33074 RepID=A0A348HH02_9GAMM|nr:hypothetical protein ZBT109_2167 [Zymobacter palmae]